MPRWTTASYDLAAYRGQTVLLAFRYVSDPRVALPGLVDRRHPARRIRRSATAARWPAGVVLAGQPEAGTVGFTVQLVGYSTAAGAFIQRLRLDGRLRGRSRAPRFAECSPRLRRRRRDRHLRRADGGEERLRPYVLRVNGRVQRGGRRERVLVRLFTDGGARGNPGPAAYGYVLEAEDGTVLAAHGEAIGIATNNVAEYRALIAGLEQAGGWAWTRSRWSRTPS